MYIHYPPLYDRGAPNASGIRSIVNRCWEMYMIGTPGIWRETRIRLGTVLAREGGTRAADTGNHERFSDSVNKLYPQ